MKLRKVKIDGYYYQDRTDHIGIGQDMYIPSHKKRILIHRSIRYQNRSVTNGLQVNIDKVL